MLTGRRRGWRLLSAVFLMPSIAHAAASFVVFDGKPGSPNDTLTYLYNISHDGKYVVGESVFHGGPHGEGGYADRTGAGWIVHRLGTLPSDEPPYGPAYDVAANASRIVGFANAGSPTLDVPTSFSPPGGPLTVLGMFPGDKVGEARGVNVNGSLLVGWGLTERTSRFGSADPYRHALLWSACSCPS